MGWYVVLTPLLLAVGDAQAAGRTRVLCDCAVTWLAGGVTQTTATKTAEMPFCAARHPSLHLRAGLPLFAVDPSRKNG